MRAKNFMWTLRQLKMNKLIYLPLILLFGCAAPRTHHTDTIYAPSVNTVKTDVAKAQNSVTAAAEKNARLNGNLNKSSDYASRIDSKSEVILRNWSKARAKKNLDIQ